MAFLASEIIYMRLQPLELIPYAALWLLLNFCFCLFVIVVGEKKRYVKYIFDRYEIEKLRLKLRNFTSIDILL